MKTRMRGTNIRAGCFWGMLTLLLAAPSFAVSSRTWDFGTNAVCCIPPQYADAIEVSEGVARLIPRTTSTHETTVSQYQAGGATLEQLDVNTSNAPTRSAAATVGLSRKPDGGCVTSGIFVSRIFDATNTVTWLGISWAAGPELTNELGGLVGLYHLNGNWADDAPAGGDNAGAPVNATFSELAKLGSKCAAFDGGISGSHVSGFGITGAVNSVAFWIQDDNAVDGIMSFGGGGGIALENHIIMTPGFSANPPRVFVNGRERSRKLATGWNCVAVVWSNAIDISVLDVGVCGGDYMGGKLDELAVYDRMLTPAEILEHFAACQAFAGRAAFQVRADNSTNALLTKEWFPPAGGYLQTPSPTFYQDGRYVQYRVELSGDGNVSPAFGAVTLAANNGGVPLQVYDQAREDFARGALGNGLMRWLGDDMHLVDLSVTAPSNMFGPAELDIDGLWHLDEAAWGVGLPVVDAVWGRDGNARNGTFPSTNDVAAGVACGSFDGANDYITLGSIPELVSSNLTVQAWFKSVATNRCAILSTYGQDGAGSHVTIEMNGDGTNISVGRVAFVINDGAGGHGSKSAVSFLTGLNNGRWHHVAGVRNREHLYVYVDGDLAGNAYLGPSYGVTVSAAPVLGKYGTQSIFFGGYIDEVAIWHRALSAAEIGKHASAGYAVADAGTYISKVIDAGRTMSWDALKWETDGPYGKELSIADPDLVGLWRLNGSANDATVDPENGTLAGGALLNGAGRFGSCLVLNGSNSWIDISDDPDLEPPAFTIALWARLSALDARVLFDKSNGGTAGYRLATDSNGCPCLTVGTRTAKNSNIALRPDTWAYLAGTYDGTALTFYVDGAPVAATSGVETVAAGNARIGAASDGAGCAAGLIDEVSLHRRVLTPGEVLDRFRAGALTLKFQGRAGDDPVALLSTNFVGPSGTTNTFFVEATGSLMSASIPFGRYFQYKACFASETHLLSPHMYGVGIDSFSYSTNNPSVEVASGCGQPFPGNITGFSHVMATNGDSSVRYQISGNNGTNWYYWEDVNNAWVDSGLYGGGYDRASSRGTISSHVGTFYKQLYEKTGGTFKFRAFLHSGGNDPVAIDSTSIIYSEGRIVMTSPNGTENGTRSWVVGSTYDVTWTSTGAVSDNIVIELFTGTNFYQTLRSGIPNSGVACNVQFPEQRGTNYWIKIRDGNNPTIWDWTDGAFSLVEQYHLTAPDGGEFWYVGRTNTIRWDSPEWGPYNFEGPANIWFSDNNGTNWFIVVTGVTNVSGKNTYGWLPPSNQASLVSASARMGVTPQGAGAPSTAMFGDQSDSNFTMAGIAITYPWSGCAIRMNSDVTVRWRAAGAGTKGVTIDFFDGLTWSNITTNAYCQGGTNAYTCRLASANPSETAHIRIKSNADPTNVWGLSDEFVFADITIISPHGGGEAERDQWQIGTTNVIKWLSAGAGNFVNISYSSDGTNWGTLFTGCRNTNSGAGYIITNSSPPWAVTGPPSSNAMVKVASQSQLDLYTISLPFDISGVKVVSPNGGEYWQFTGTNKISWLNRAAGAFGALDIAYVSNPTSNDYETILPTVPFVIMERSITPDMIRRPSTVARVRIRALSPPSGIPMVDYSDTPFTIRGVSMAQPTSNAVYTLGKSVPDGLQWYSARAGANIATLYYSSDDGVTYNDVITFSSIPFIGNVDADPSWNHQVWDISSRLRPSLNARVKVVIASYQAVSQQFKMRGIRITRPGAGEAYDIGINTNIVWVSAALSPTAYVSNSLSVNGMAGPFVSAGLSGNAMVLVGAASWNMDPSLDPTTNAVIRTMVTTPTQDLDIVAYSDPFTLRGLKVLSPNTGTNWTLGGTGTIRFLAAGMSAGARAAIYYSPDGVDYDTNCPIARDLVVTDGVNKLSWNIEASSDLTRMPSTGAYVRVVCGAYANSSKPFRMSGLKVTTPSAQDIWAVNDITNTIRWVGVDTWGSFDVSHTVYSAGQPVYNGIIALCATDYYADWIMSSNCIGTNTITVRDGSYTAVSERFLVVPRPSIRIVNPAPGDFWKVGGTNVIQWTAAGTISNSFWLAWSPYPYIVTNVLCDGQCPVSGRTYSYTWADIPNSLGPVRLIVTNNFDALVQDVFEDFEIAAKFRIDPFEGESFAREPKAVNWTTYGSLLKGVDFYWSSDFGRATNSWHHINPGEPFMAAWHNMPSTYLWTTANVKTNTVWLRIQDHGYSNRVFDASKPGPYDDLGMFEIKYYKVFWEVIDSITSNQLNKLWVNDDSGWFASDLSCVSNPPPSVIYHEYPYGTWNTEWHREGFQDELVMYWESKNQALNSPQTWTQRVVMVRGEHAHDYEVKADFYYAATNNMLTVHSWLEYDGDIMRTPSLCVVSVYDQRGTMVDQFTNASPFATGVFITSRDVSCLEEGRPYFADVRITFSGFDYSGGSSFMLAEGGGLEELNVHYVATNGLHVSPFLSWETAATSLEAAVAAASDGDTIYVSNGTYRLFGQVTLGGAIRISGVNGAAETIVEGNGTTRCFYLSDVDALLEGLTIRNGRTSGGASSVGGGVYCFAGTVRDCVISGNSVGALPPYLFPALGGGLYCGPDALVERCIISGNSATNYGGGVFMEGEGTLRNCMVRDNRAGQAGDGIYVFGAGKVVNCTLAGAAGDAGSALACDGGGDILNTIIRVDGGAGWTNLGGGWSYNCCCASPAPPGAWNFDADPQLTPAGRLTSSSPCIDAGTPEGAPAADIDNEVRWDHPGHSNVCSTYDIGADEYVDEDFDAMADAWETRYLGSSTNSSGSGDSDSDGLEDAEEYWRATSPADPDSDADTMSDGWEVAFGFDPLADDAQSDADSDGMANGREYGAGTNPTNSDSYLGITAVSIQPAYNLLTWRTVFGKGYFLQRTDNLSNTTWSNLYETAVYESDESPEGTESVLDPFPPPGPVFYRIRVE